MKGLLISLFLTQVADLVTTHIGLSRGCMELNPLYWGVSSNILAMYGAKGASILIIATVAWKGQKVYPRQAKLVAWTGIITGVGATAWNLYQIPQC